MMDDATSGGYMVRANIKNAAGVYIGLIDEVSGRFLIVWNRNMNQYPEYDRSGTDRLYGNFDEACRGAIQAAPDAVISETIYYRAPQGG